MISVAARLTRPVVIVVQEELLRVRKDLLKDTLSYFRELAKGDAKEGKEREQPWQRAEAERSLTETMCCGFHA